MTARDRRSGRGKTAGAPAHLPVPPGAALRVSADDRAFLAAAYQAVEEAGRAADAATEAARQALARRAFAIRHFFRKYGLGETDGIDYETGEIRRGGAPR